MHPVNGSCTSHLGWGCSINLVDKITRFVSHIYFLTSCFNHQIIPTGFCLQYGEYGLPETLRGEIRTSLNSASLHIVLKVISFYKTEVLTLNKKLTDNISLAFLTLNSSSYNKFISTLRDKENRTRALYLQRKNKKLSVLLAKKQSTHRASLTVSPCLSSMAMPPETAFPSCLSSSAASTPTISSLATSGPSCLSSVAASSAALPPSDCPPLFFPSVIASPVSNLSTTVSAALLSNTAHCLSLTAASPASQLSSHIPEALSSVSPNCVSSTAASPVSQLPSLVPTELSSVPPLYLSSTAVSPVIPLASPIPVALSSVSSTVSKVHPPSHAVPPTSPSAPAAVRACQSKRKNRRFIRRFSVTPDPKQVINLSKIQLTEDQTHVLSLGPKFCPTPTNINKLQLLEDTLEGMRRLRLKEYFLKDDTPAQLPTHPKFYKKTYWSPKNGRDEALDAYCSTIQTRVKAFKPVPNKKRNVSHKSQRAIHELKQMVDDREIRIVPADKGGAVVVQDSAEYIKEAKRQLNDTTTYEKLSSDPTKEIAEKSNEILTVLKNKGHIDNATYNWGVLDPDKTNCHTFYHLPKIHKSLDNPPGRPIVSGIKGPTENLSKLVDHWLQPVVHNLPSFVKDTTHFLRIVEEWKTTFQPLPADTLIVTIDVVGLYTNIPHQEVGPSIQAALNQYRAEPTCPPHDLLLSIIEHVLHNNVFQFDNETYKQKFGTAMGTPMAPTIANIFMAWVEDRLLTSSPWTIRQNCWKRFIDDIAMLWFHGDVQLQLFLQWINTLHPTIKFTANYGVCSIPYLDVALSIVDNEIYTDIHIKPTDANMCLPFHSCHPRHCARSIPFSQCLRIRRICSTDMAFMKRALELKERLLRRGYPISLLNMAIQKVAAIPRSNTLTYKEKQPSDRVPVIITHNPANPPMSQWLKDYLPVLHSSVRMQKAVPKPPIVGERNCKNLRRILMPSKLPAPAQPTRCRNKDTEQLPVVLRRQQELHQQLSNQTQQRPALQQHDQPLAQPVVQQPTLDSQLSSPEQHKNEPSQQHSSNILLHQQADTPQGEHHNQPCQQQQHNGCYTCTAKRCVVCQNHLLSTNTFHSVRNGVRHLIRSKMSCDSQNLIYLLDCAQCRQAQYVGETGQTLKKRLYGHRHNILHYTDYKASDDNTNSTSKYIKEDTMVAKHFNLPQHTIADMKCTAIEKIHAENTNLRKRKEKFWRHQLQTNFPDGLNVFD